MWIIIVIAIVLFVMIYAICKVKSKNNTMMKTEQTTEVSTKKLEETAKKIAEFNYMKNHIESEIKEHENSINNYITNNIVHSNDYEKAQTILSDAMEKEKLLRNPKSVQRHFELIQFIQENYSAGNYTPCITFCLEDIAQFKQFERDYFSAYNEDCKELQLVSFETLCKIYEKQKCYIQAIEICDLAIEYNLTDGTKGGFSARKERLQKKNSITKSISNSEIKPEIQKPNTQVRVIEKAKNNIVKTSPDSSWNISVSFGKSSSDNYIKAVYLAKQADNYLEDIFDEKILHQATFGKESSSYLKFISLYELVSSWKSSFILINGEVVDRKIVQGLNYCYGDKCRSGKSDFCFGASEMTENPFGCHRLQMSKANHPWWSFGYWENDNFIIDKSQIKKRTQEYGYPYRHCPSYNDIAIMSAIEKIPSIILKDDYNSFIENNHGYDMIN